MPMKVVGQLGLAEEEGTCVVPLAIHHGTYGK